MRQAKVSRKTNETDITVSLNIDGKGTVKCSSGNGFFDHMINSMGKHAGYDIEIDCKGDTFVDFHHSAEDIGIVLGKAFAECVGDKKGIKRFGLAYTPMDEALAMSAVDISGRPFLVFNAEMPAERVGEFETELVEEFMRAFAMNALITLHVNVLYGKNTHHIIEALFKSVGRALSDSTKITGDAVLSTKGVL
ncbi:MAG: imidazoleglycerol-phosphate dehydratase HisB [Anaerovoracaceae bacterium]|nr:imidazoleglycerol-phosphate dehydratase HisB [Bacillota bacterium]MDY2670479.1 imidazoleglycerol-phosphate dehydratase HisB [Anaerovoracaceae bacterium]